MIGSGDFVGRYGGEEFALVVQAPLHDAYDLAERLRRVISESPVATVAGPVEVTASVGVAEMGPRDADLGRLLQRTDAALYEAKGAGRDQVARAVAREDPARLRQCRGGRSDTIAVAGGDDSAQVATPPCRYLELCESALTPCRSGKSGTSRASICSRPAARPRLVMDRSGTIVYCNAASEQLQRRRRGEIIGRSIECFSSARSVGPASSVWDLLLQGEHWSGDVWVNRGDGSRVPAHATRSPLVGSDGGVVGVLSLATDRTNEQAAKAALVASEKRFRALVQRSSDLALLLAGDGTVLYVSPSIEPISGLHAHELLGTNAWNYVHPGDLAEMREAVSERLSPDEPVVGEWRMVTAAGWRWFEMTLTDMRDDPAVGGIVGNLRDVTERRRSLEATRTLAERFRRVFDESPVGKMVVDAELRIVEANQALCESLGYRAGELQGISIDRFVHSSDVEEQRARWAALFRGEVDRFRVQLRYRRRDGSEVTARLRAWPRCTTRPAPP